MKKRQYLWLFGFVAGLSAIGLYLQRWNRQFLKYKVAAKALPTDAGQLQLGKQVQVTTFLDCPADKLWQLVLTSGLTEHLSWPCLTFIPVERTALPAVWKEGETIHLDLRLFDWLPLGRHTIMVEKVDQQGLRIQTQESGRIVRVWNHTIELSRVNDFQTLYTDSIDVHAGWMTEWIAGLVSWFFRYRQARLKKLAARLGSAE